MRGGFSRRKHEVMEHLALGGGEQRLKNLRLRHREKVGRNRGMPGRWGWHGRPRRTLCGIWTWPWWQWESPRRHIGKNRLEGIKSGQKKSVECVKPCFYSQDTGIIHSRSLSFQPSSIGLCTTFHCLWGHTTGNGLGISQQTNFHWFNWFIQNDTWCKAQKHKEE